MSLTQDQIISKKEWNESIRNAVESAMGLMLDGKFTPVPCSAGFPVATKQQFYNKAFLNTLDTRIETEDGLEVLKGSFSGYYKKVIHALKYDVSSADKALINQEETAQKGLIGQIIDAYNQIGLDEKPDEYITVREIIKRVQEVTGKDYLSVDIKEYPEFGNLCSLLSQFAQRAVNYNKLSSAWSLAEIRKGAIVDHIENPDVANGGLKTNSSDVNIGWESIPETGQLLAGLKASKSIEISMVANQFAQNSSDLHFESDVTARIPFNWFLNLKVNNEHEYDLLKFAGSDASMEMKVKFNGVTEVAAVPMNISEDNAKGWFDDMILQEAAEKSGKDATGYQLNGSEFDREEVFGSKGKLRRLRTFVISQHPEITLSFTHFQREGMEEFFKQNTDISFNILGSLLGGGTHNNDYSSHDYSYQESEDKVTVTFSPVPIGDTGSLEKQTAYVLGGVVECYGKN